MSKPYCGINNIPKGHHLGSMKECAETKQVRYYGTKKVDAKLLDIARGKENKLLNRDKAILELTKFKGKLKNRKNALEFIDDKLRKDPGDNKLLDEKMKVEKEILKIEKEIEKWREIFKGFEERKTGNVDKIVQKIDNKVENVIKKEVKKLPISKMKQEKVIDKIDKEVEKVIKNEVKNNDFIQEIVKKANERKERNPSISIIPKKYNVNIEELKNVKIDKNKDYPISFISELVAKKARERLSKHPIERLDINKLRKKFESKYPEDEEKYNEIIKSLKKEMKKHPIEEFDISKLKKKFESKYPEDEEKYNEIVKSFKKKENSIKNLAQEEFDLGIKLNNMGIYNFNKLYNDKKIDNIILRIKEIQKEIDKKLSK